MKKFFILETEKQEILNKYYPKEILSEQAKGALAKILGGSYDDIFKLLTRGSFETIEGLMTQALKPQNLYQRGNQFFIKSARGTEVPVEQIRGAITDVLVNGKPASSVATKFPSYLADGTEFRDLIIKQLEKSQSQNLISRTGSVTSSNLPLTQLGKDLLELIQNRGWVQVYDTRGNMSGWKFHIYADNLNEVAFLYEKLLPVVKSYGAGMKIAGGEKLQRLALNELQKGKAVTLYVPSEVVAKNAQRKFLSDVQNSISGYKKSGKIAGDRMITDNIGYRYELSQPINPAKGVNMSEYSKLYKSNDGGPHNIPGNVDLFN